MIAPASDVAVIARPGEAREEWTRPAPAEWERRLREISPIVDKTSHLRFRWRAENEAWALYQCTPAPLVSPDRVAQLSVHWSDLPAGDQQGRKQLVTEYQHYMWHRHRLSVGLFWNLQGTEFIVGGTPAFYTDRERRILEAQNESGDAIPPGTLPNIPFDERVVSAILARDLLIKAGNSLDALEKSRTGDALRREDEETDREFRRAFLKWHHTNNAPSAEFMKWFLTQKESRFALRPGSRDDANKMADWQDRFIETGDIGGGIPSSTKTSILVQ